ncbi:MAG TPA: FAD-dependent oxidoreductase [Mycobacteriales bacterium]|nr:FAD-dependent oxidoreductase [Mycobacteriales bacterium]
MGQDAAGSAARPRVAVIGAGVSGLTAAYLLRRTHQVTLFEADPRLGGHAHTHHVVDGAGAAHAVDTGFIVHNDRTYPLLQRLFRELAVPVQPTEMSMSVRCDGCGLEYAGGRGVRGLLAQPGRIADPRYRRLLREVVRFHRRASAFLHAGGDDTTTYGDFLAAEGFDEHFVSHYAVPVVSCVWSAGREPSLWYPAQYLFRFLDHHGMLRITGSPQWFTVVGGSRTYVDRIADVLRDVRIARAVTDVVRHADGVTVRDVTGAVTEVDRVVIATHADRALALLADPTDDEVEVLKAFSYSTNRTVLHSDATTLPAARGARASWNYRMRSCHGDQPAVVTYWMNKLQHLRSGQDFLVALNDDSVDPDAVLASMTYDHPIYTPDALRAQGRLADLATDRTVYAGAHHGWGFHEDGCRSGVEAARHFGVRW